VLGKSHLIVGAAGFLTTAQPILHLTHQPALKIPELIAGTVVCAGAAMLPDIDHPNATVAHSLGIVTAAISKVVSKLAGGHRMGTHSIPFALGLGVATTLGLHHWHSPLLALLICFFLISLCIRVLTEASGIVCAVISAAVAGVIVMAVPLQKTGLAWLTVAIILGCLLHMLADMVTTEGIPLLWPLSKKKISIPVVGHTGGLREKITAGLCGALTVYVFATVVVLPSLFPTLAVPAYFGLG
jgi:membrane-bound metal-dependent hydrolase YbcI (DUF457 family)